MSRGIFVGLALPIVLGVGCSSGATCPDDPTACRGRVQIRWLLMTEELDDFAFNETCAPLEADKVQLDFDGPKISSEQYSCQDGQTLLLGLPVGDYSLIGTLLHEDEEGAMTPITRGGAATAFYFDETDITVDVIFPYEDFVGSYLGSYYFKTRWGSADSCETAVPPVDQVTVRLERDGEPVQGVTPEGMSLDGSAFGPCKDFAMSPYLANDVAWGPADITITGRNEDGVPLYESTFPTFVGAGRANPEFQFDVNAL
jgi:hypothetical protein